MRARRPNPIGWFLIACGMVFLILGVGGTLFPMSTISFGPVEVGGISAFSAISTFIGIVLIAIGATISLGKRPF